MGGARIRKSSVYSTQNSLRHSMSMASTWILLSFLSILTFFASQALVRNDRNIQSINDIKDAEGRGIRPLLLPSKELFRLKASKNPKKITVKAWKRQWVKLDESHR